MSEYQVIARKWRPQTFGDVVGQEHVLRTLKNAIINNKTAHAYLFVGPRGIGKTTTARIFAKALNCTNLHGGEPCGECPSCAAVNLDASLDVIEIDAASHNTADYMRELAEEVLHLPVSGRYKIYIIDEVHMLSKAAWNALLKTVEEPPAHIKFIFATTEAHAVLPTIVSRCQRFDLQPIPGNLIYDRLTMIAAAENIKISESALRAISRAASGGMRDAQSLLDQLTAFFSGSDDEEIDEETVLAMFALTAGPELESIIAAMAANDAAKVVCGISTLAGRGRNLETLFDDILTVLRGAELILLLGDRASEVLDEDNETMARFTRLANMSNLPVFRSLLETLSSVGRILRDAMNKQIFLETILLKAMRLAHAVKLEDVLARLNQLRKAGELDFVDKLPAQIPVQIPVSATPLPQNYVQASDPVNQISRQTEEMSPAQKTQIENQTIKTSDDDIRDEEEIPPLAPINGTSKSASQTIDGGNLWLKLVDSISSELNTTWNDILTSATVTGYVDSTLKIELPFDPANRLTIEEIRTIEAQLLSSMQNITGNWACSIQLDYPEPSKFEPEEHLIEPEAEKSMPAAIDEERIAIKPEIIQPHSPAVSKYDDENDEDIIADADLTADDTIAEENDSSLNVVLENESLLSNPDELKKARQEPAITLIRDFFGAEIVDIHRI